MISIPQLILLALLLLLLRIIYFFFIGPFVLYFKMVRIFGYNHVSLIYRPFASPFAQYERGTRLYGDSFGKYLVKAKQNPLLKVIVSMMAIGTSLVFTDSEIIRKLSSDHVKNIEKNNIIMFVDEVKKGLLFEEGEEWKKSRQIISNLFHFEKLKEREDLMEKVIQRGIQGLDGKVPTLFLLGREIGGEIVVVSLFGEEYFKIKFGENNPYQEIHEILTCMMIETLSPGNILRIIFKKRATKDSWFLTASQKRLINKLLNFKAVTTEFLLKQKQRFQSGKPVSPFIQTYFKQQDDSYIQQLIHQLFFFLFAGEDTTGSLIEMCIALLSIHPEYQQRILDDVAATSIHTSKELNNFINEVSRLKGTINISFPRLVAKPFTCEGVDFEPGMDISLLIGALSHNPRYWEDPEVFLPERWNKPIENSNAFIPFMSGPRNCIGQHMALMEIRILLVRVLEMYRLKKVGDSMATKSDNIINHLVNGKYVKFHLKK